MIMRKLNSKKKQNYIVWIQTDADIREMLKQDLILQIMN